MSKNIHPKDPRNAVEIAKRVAKYRLIKPVDLVSEYEELSGFKERGEVTSGLEPIRGPLTDAHLHHLLKRMVPGFTKEMLRSFSGMSVDDVLDVLLVESPAPSPPVNDYYHLMEDPDVPPGESWVEAAWDLELAGPRLLSYKAWLAKRLINAGRSFHEKMVLFWHNHFVTQSWDIFIPKASYQYYTTLHSNAFGNVRNLTRAVTLDPAMLVYLNGTFNSKQAPDENFSRELQELFCVGKGPMSGYTEEDVQRAAKVLTGWKLDYQTVISEGRIEVRFYGFDHDTTDKQFSSFYGNRVIEGRSGVAGAEELDDLLDMIYAQRETARHICRRLYQFFVYNDIDQTTEQNVIDTLADVFISEGFEIKPVLRVLFSSAHFFDEENMGASIKHPVDAVVGLWRTLGAEVPMHFSDTQQMEAFQSIMWQMSVLGMELGDPPSVAGWPAYHQAPIYDKAWITTNTITNRALVSDSLVYWGFWNPVEPITTDLIAFTGTLNQPEDPNKLIDEAVRLVAGLDLTESDKAGLKDILLSGQQNDSYWTIAWNGLVASPANEQLRQLVNFRLQLFYHTLFQKAEFQLL